MLVALSCEKEKESSIWQVMIVFLSSVHELMPDRTTNNFDIFPCKVFEEYCQVVNSTWQRFVLEIFAKQTGYPNCASCDNHMLPCKNQCKSGK